MSNRERYLAVLGLLIHTRYGCKSRHVTMLLVDSQNGNLGGISEVELFEVYGVCKATHCYVWTREVEGPHDKESRVVTILNLPPIASPKDAIDFWRRTKSLTSPESEWKRPARSLEQSTEG